MCCITARQGYVNNMSQAAPRDIPPRFSFADLSESLPEHVWARQNGLYFREAGQENQKKT